MVYLYITLGFLAILAIAGLAIWRRRARLTGYKGWLWSPKYKQSVIAAVSAEFAAMDPKNLPKNLSSKQIAQMVEMLFHGDAGKIAFRQIEALGAPAVPHLVGALDDKRTWEGGSGGGMSIVWPTTPFDRIANLLETAGTRGAIPGATRFLGHTSVATRARAARLLAAIGAPECVEPVRRALSDEEIDVRYMALTGFGIARHYKRHDPSFLAPLFDPVAACYRSGERKLVENSVGVLLSIDTGRAMRLLLPSESSSLRSTPGLYSILQAANKDGTRFPQAFLRRLLAELDAEKDDHLVKGALIALATNPDAETERTLRAALESTNHDIQEGGAEGLCILLGVGDPYTVTDQITRRSRLEDLPEPNRHVANVILYHYQHMNGGMSQYFANGYGNGLMGVLAGFEAMGDTHRAAYIREVASLFGPDGPQGDDPHHDLSAKQKRKFEELDDRRDDAPDSIDKVIRLYAIKHPECFRPIPESEMLRDE